MPSNLVIAGGRVLTPRGWSETDVVVEQGRIARLGRSGRTTKDVEIVEARGARVLPGLIDLQVNGAFGRSLAAASAAEIAEVARGLTRLGVTGFLATIVSLPIPRIVEGLARIREAAAAGGGAEILGAHLEGPFLNAEQAGAHRRDHIRPPNLVEFTKLATAGDGIARMMTLAPEVKGAVSIVAAGVKRGMVMAIGHSSAARSDVEAAVRAGATVVTHLYNAMAAFHHRNDNVVSASLVDDRLTCACIYDRHHVNAAALTIALRCKPPGRLALISDATPALEAPDGTFDVDGTKFVVKDGQVTVRGSARLGGSAVALLQCVRNTVEDLGLPFEEAWRFGSAVPARVLGLEKRKGEIAPGSDGDLVVLDEHWKVRATIVRGTVVHGGHHQA